EIYPNGISTSLPPEVQQQFVRTIPGLEDAVLLRPGYAVEYDFLATDQLRADLQVAGVAGLFAAGQINGTSGYEEAAAQGIVAGINAAQYVARGAADFVLRRDQAYVGVLVDDLVTKPPIEPYRMFTSRAEHRLHLRSDNADERLTGIGREIGLVDDARSQQFQSVREASDAAAALLSHACLEGVPAAELLRRPEVTWDDLAARHAPLAAVPRGIGRRVEVRVKYEGYIARQDRHIERLSQLESKLIPPSLNYSEVPGLRNEAKQKFGQFTPRSLGQALRISGITPADVTVLAVHLERKARPLTK
ncbi:MAG TPA: FAD-dependent oxidoreductase, partial [Tepidisphaeraceae bacterium]|nr:FAD-dependent oxidoreductase [Tepidisphaeraceae bacterium]